MAEDEVYIPLSEYLPAESWLADLLAPDDAGFLDKIAYDDGLILFGEESIRAGAALRVMVETSFQLPAGFAFVVGSGAVAASFDAGPNRFRAEVDLEILKLRLPRTLFTPVIEEDDELKPDPDPGHFVDITLPVGLAVDQDLNVDLRWPGGTPGQLDLPPCMIGQSGVIISAQDLFIRLSQKQPLPDGAAALGLGADWRGVFISEAAIQLPAGMASAIPSDLTFSDCYIGTGGFSGAVAAEWDPALSGTLFGVEFGLERFGLSFRQNALIGSEIGGTIRLPFFDEPVGVTIGFTVGGALTVGLSNPTGLATIEKPGLLRLDLASLGFQLEDGLFVAKLSGQVTPLLGGLDWPTFDIKELSIDSQGNVRIQGGWLDLPSQYSLDFHGFQFEITKLGFGKTDDGGKWVGFSGGIKLVDGMPAGVSADGLRVAWYDDGRPPAITLSGVGVEFETPEVLRFKGAVAYRELPGGVHRFDGAITLELLALDLEIDALLVVGSAPGHTFFAIYLGVELPAGIPLWATGLALYGMAGLFALNMEPDKLPDEEWYGIGPTDGWYKRGAPGVTDLATKWKDAPGSRALGAGVTIGTVADNGFTFSGKMLLAIVFPGPILLIEGKANLLKERAALDEEPTFRALAVLDRRAATFLIGLDAQYTFAGGGELIDIHGGAEASFSFDDASAWHLYLGERDPPERRIRAEIFKLFESDSYFMLDATQVAVGARTGYDNHWQFGPLSVTLESWTEGNAIVSWKPAHFYGDLWLHGKVELSAFGFGLALSVDARIAADVFDPFHIVGEFNVAINLPWPLPDFDVDITLEWGPAPTPPALPLPLKEIAVEHFKVTTSWPLPRDGVALLLPNYDRGDGFLASPPPTPNPNAAPPAQQQIPVTPLDSRPHITFGRAVHDDAQIGVNPQPLVPAWERIGDPARNEGPVRVRYGLKEVALHRRSGGAWALVARKAADPNPPDIPTLYGSWAPTPHMPDGGGANAGQVKLWIWSRTPFDYARHTGSGWDDWFAGRFKGYPCIAPAPDREICCDFQQVGRAEILKSPWTCSSDKRIVLSWLAPEAQSATALDPPVAGRTRGLCFPATALDRRGVARPNEVRIDLAEPASEVRIVVAEPAAETGRVCVAFTRYAPSSGPNPRVERDTRFEVRDAKGSLVAQTQIVAVKTKSGTISGLDCGFALEITLPCPASSVELTLTHAAGPASVAALDARKQVVDKAATGDALQEPETLRLEGKAIARVVVQAPSDQTALHELCFTCAPAARLTATGAGKDGAQYGPVAARDQQITLAGKDLVSVRLSSSDQFCVARVCATIGPDPAEAGRRREMAQHLVDELARWSQEGNVLAPHTTYRLTVVTTLETADFPASSFNQVRTQTEFAYFRTEGPPGLADLSTPRGHPAPDEFDSGLDDLTRYVRQTMPATSPGEHSTPPGPVYRAYDVGVEFNEEYVDLLYRLERRDLGLYLYDSNNRPVRDAQGRLVALNNRWGQAQSLTLSESEELWAATVNASGCATLDTSIVPHDTTLSAAASGQTLDGDTVYEVRLIPLLLHEDFASYAVGAGANGPVGKLDRWQVRDEGNTGGPSHWEVRLQGTPPQRSIAQTTDIAGGATGGADPVKPGTLLLYGDNPALPAAHPEQPGAWTDYRMSVYLRAADDDAIGVVFRYRDQTTYYRLSLDRERSYRRLVRVAGGAHAILAQDNFSYLLNHDYLITVEAIGASLRVYQDGALVFDVTDAQIDRGRIGLYCWANPGASFADLRIDDLRKDAPVVYRFSFTTSRFANFYHQMHSFQDETWSAALPAAAAPAALLSQAVLPTTAPSDAERRAYEALATLAFGPGARQDPPEVQVTRVVQSGATLALHVESPEPIDWRRASLEVRYADRQAPQPDAPRAVKLTQVSFGATQANQETVTLLLREAVDLSGMRIEYRQISDPAANPAWESYYAFGSEERLPAGARVRVYAGSAAAAPAQEPGVIRRFIASPGAQGQIRLPATGADLRLVAPDGVAGHTRRFLPESAYAALTVRVLRNADGTRFFVVRPAGSALAAGQYRLGLTYRRDNRAADPASQVLSEAGDTAPEQVALDIP